MRSPRRFVALALGVVMAVAVVPPAWSATPGPAYSWGDNAHGRLGTAQLTSVDDSVPTAMAAPVEFGLISAGWNHGCGLAAGGAAWCWGGPAYFGQPKLGDGTTTQSSTPVAVVDGFEYNNIDSGRDSTCAVLEGDDTIYCWGQNDSGQLGDGTTTDDSTPVQVVESPHPLTSIDSISAGGSSACAVANDDTAYCWGNNEYGHLGNGNMTTDDSVPVPVSGAYRFVEVSVGEDFACGVTRDDTGASGPGVCWGRNDSGQLGKGTTSVTGTLDDSVPRPIVGGLTLTSIASGAGHACAISIDDSVYCWGKNDSGQLGIGSTDDTSVPSRVAIPAGVAVRDVSAGYSNTCAVTDDSTYCWGSGSRGQLGNGSIIQSTTPVAVTLAGIDSQNSPVQVTSGEDYNAFIVKPRMTFDDTEFQSVQVGQSTTTTVTVDNNRPRDMSVTGVSVAGSGLAIGSTTCSGVLTPTSPCTVTLLWSPSAAGPLSATLTVSYVGNSSSTPLNGTAAAAPTPAAPSPPRDVTAVATDASAAVAWTTPVDPGSFPVSNYAVTASPGGKTCLTPTLTCQVTGLTNGTRYTFTVKALNGAGWSAESAPSNAVTPKATAKPSILITGSRDGSTIRVDGTTTDLTGTVTPWVRFPGQTRYTEGTARPVITDNAFAWSRNANKKAYVYFTQGATKSNTVTIAAR